MLSLRIDLLTGRYVASEFNDRTRAEWPPHPARVFSALVAAHYEGGPTEPQRRALRWLESQPGPRISFSKASARSLMTHYVPVNDKALSDAATVDNAWANLLAPGQTDKQRAKAEQRLRHAYAKTSAPDKKLAKNFAAAVRHVLPSSRTRQPRTFPSMTPEDPVVWLCWDAEPKPEVRTGLDALARMTVRLGHSSSLVALRWTNDTPSPTWIPDPDGNELLRWVGPGQLDALTALHAAAPAAEQRVMPYVVTRYRPVVATPARSTSSFASRFIVLQRITGARLPILATEAVAQALRGALMSHADDPPAPLISGHEPNGGPLQDDHLAVVPLPFVGHRHATGDLLGVALVPPADLELDALHPLYTAMARWEAATHAQGDGPRSTLTLGSLGSWMLERTIEIAPLHNLRESAWTRASTVWTSVTPMVLDRHPGSLDDGRASCRRRAINRAHTTIAAACRRIGVPEPEQIELRRAPFLRGSEPAERFARRRGSEDRRPLIHARLTFPHPVQGPVLLGAGRYRGLGLFRPTEDPLHG